MSKFVTIKWIQLNDLLGGQYSINKNVRFKTPMLRSELYNYSDAYVVVKDTITVEGTVNAKKRNKKLTFKNNAPCKSCISKINNTFIDNAEVLDIVPLMCVLLEYSGNYSMTSRSLWNYYKDKVTEDANENDSADNGRVKKASKIKTSKLFVYKAKIIGSTAADYIRHISCCFIKIFE